MDILCCSDNTRTQNQSFSYYVSYLSIIYKPWVTYIVDWLSRGDNNQWVTYIIDWLSRGDIING